MKFSLKENKKYQLGQTLIETVVAVFILVMGIVAALGLAIYALNASSNVSKQIIGIGLAREGIEAVKNMRDTNWLKSSVSTNCYNYSSGSNNASCYDKWLGDSGCGGTGNDKGFCIFNTGSGTKSFRLSVQPNIADKFWAFDEENQNEFGLNLDSNVSNSSFAGFYVSANGLANGSSDFYREIVLTKDTSGAFTQNNMERLQVKARVWWVDKKCPRVVAFSSAKVTCRIELQSYLTNWKNW
jgi:hypothetical protein